MEVIAGFIALGVACVVVVALFFVFRQAALWYWRINEMHDELRRSNDRLNEIAALLRDATRKAP